MFGRNRVRSTCFIFLMRDDFRWDGRHFARRVVSTRVRLSRFADISTLPHNALYFSKSLANWLLVSRNLLDGSWRPVSNQVGPPTFLPSLKTHQRYFSKSLANWLPVCLVAFRKTGCKSPCPIVSIHRHFYPLWNPPATYIAESLANWLLVCRVRPIMMARVWPTRSDRLGLPTLLSSLKPTCHQSLSRTNLPFGRVAFFRRAVMARVRSTQSADISTLSEAYLPYFSKSLANWLQVSQVALC